MKRHVFGAVAAAAILLASAAPAKSPPPTWDDLVLVNSQRFHAAYMLPGADFRPYTKVMFDPTEMAFKKDFIRDYNNTATGLSRRIQPSDAQKAMDTAKTRFSEVFTQVFNDGGYQVVTTPGPDVLRVRTAVIDITVNAPDIAFAGRSRSYSEEAGAATIVIEARDSQSGAILGRVVDRKLAGETSMWIRNSMTNKNDFARLFKNWAQKAVAGLNEMRSRAPANATTAIRAN